MFEFTLELQLKLEDKPKMTWAFSGKDFIWLNLLTV